MKNNFDTTTKLRANCQIFPEACISPFIGLDLEEEVAPKMRQFYYRGDIKDYVS